MLNTARPILCVKGSIEYPRNENATAAASPKPLLHRKENNTTHNESAIKFVLGITPIIMPSVKPRASCPGAVLATSERARLRTMAITSESIRIPFRRGGKFKGGNLGAILR